MVPLTQSKSKTIISYLDMAPENEPAKNLPLKCNTQGFIATNWLANNCFSANHKNDKSIVLMTISSA